MTQQAKPARRIGPWLFWLWLILAIVIFILAYWGWYDQAAALHARGWRAHENAAFMAIRAFGSSSAYGDPRLIGTDWRLIVSRWTGLAVFTATVAAAGLELSRAQVASAVAAGRKRHVLIIGDHEMANALGKRPRAAASPPCTSAQPAPRRTRRAR